MRGLQGANEAKLTEAVQSFISFKVDKKASAEDDIVVPADAKFSDGAWAFKGLGGGEYIRKFSECDESELREVCSIFFYEIQRLQQELALEKKKSRSLETELTIAMTPPLQLLG